MSDAVLDYSHYYWQASTIRLRALTLEDANSRFAQTLDSISREEFNIGIELPSTVALQRGWLEKFGGCKQVNGMIALAVETHEQQFVGIAIIQDIDERHGKFGFSVFIDRPHRQQGYASEAVQLILKYGFLERRLHKCNSACASYNEASIAMHQKLGFVEEGRLRKEYFYNGKHHDEMVYGLLLEEYLAKNPVHD